MEKRTVKKIYHMDDYTLIRAIVIGIAYREKIKSRHDMIKIRNKHRNNDRFIQVCFKLTL